MLILDSDPTTAETPLPLGTFATLHSGGADRSLRVRKPSSSSCTRAEQSHSLLSLSRGAPGIPCWTRPPGHAATCQGMPRSCSSRPQSHGSCTWPAPSGSASPWPLPGNGRRAGCCLTRRKASQNSRSEGMREFKRHLPSLPPSSMGFGCAGRTPHPQAPQQALCRAPPDATVLVETGISQVQRSFSCSPAAGKRINSQIRVLRRRKHQRRSS